ncbi:MAG: hypothetical protein KTR20_11405 [Cellvibrionaceae bacterium]|nr:hypothetical protein [Cellvibrionaceae bacterium]
MNARPADIDPKRIDPKRIDPKLLDLLPHRPPMLLLHQLHHVDAQSASAGVYIHQQTPFFETGQGVPTWIGIEYMGQTAALIAGNQARQAPGDAAALGLLLGTRHYRADSSHFQPGATLRIHCQQEARVGDELATFACTICHAGEDKPIASAKLSVLRRPTI